MEFITDDDEQYPLVDHNLKKTKNGKFAAINDIENFEEIYENYLYENYEIKIDKNNNKDINPIEKEVLRNEKKCKTTFKIRYNHS